MKTAFSLTTFLFRPVSGLALGCTLMLAVPFVPAQALAQGAVTSGASMVVQSALPRLTAAFRQAAAAAASDDAAIAAFYRDRDYAAVWTGPRDAERRAALLAALAQAPVHALPRGRYDVSDLIAAFEAVRTEGDRGRLDVAMTRALLSYARDLQTGILTPRKVNAGIVRDVPLRDRRELLNRIVAEGPGAEDPQMVLRSLVPQHDEYARLVKARVLLLRDIAAGGWGPTVPARALKPGARGAEVVALRERMVRLGYLRPTASADYDADLQAAVQSFQVDMGLVADGVAGDGTMVEINAGPEDRLKSVVVAMERERWLNMPRGKRHIWVNLTDFSAKIIDEGKVTFATRAVVGSTISDKRTPEFSDKMTYMELNPDWTVPRGIIRRDYLPALQRNPGALRHLQLVDGRGRVVSRDAVDFSQYTANNFPFNLRQPPGSSNALGRVKFMFPNPHAIYLHDTPEKHLFSRESRTYSSGCVRLNDPFDFAYALLARQEADPVRAFHSVLDTGRQERISLRDPVPIHLVYRTAFTTAKGKVQYRRDIYGRDAEILGALLRAGVDLTALPG